MPEEDLRSGLNIGDAQVQRELVEESFARSASGGGDAVSKDAKSFRDLARRRAIRLMRSSHRLFALTLGLATCFGCSHGGTRGEALSLARERVDRFCRDFPAGCKDLSGPVDVPSARGSHAFQWRDPQGRPVLLVVVDESGAAELSFEEAFDPAVLTDPHAQPGK